MWPEFLHINGPGRLHGGIGPTFLLTAFLVYFLQTFLYRDPSLFSEYHKQVRMEQPLLRSAQHTMLVSPPQHKRGASLDDVILLQIPGRLFNCLYLVFVKSVNLHIRHIVSHKSKYAQYIFRYNQYMTDPRFHTLSSTSMHQYILFCLGYYSRTQHAWCAVFLTL